MKSRRLFIDTNLFLRYLTNDVPEQADAVEKLLEQAVAGDIILTTNCLVMAEIVWTLESFYRLPKNKIQEKILAILNTPGLEVAEGELILQAVTWYVKQNVNFIDAYNVAWSLAQEIDEVCTFDRKHFARLPGISVCVPG